MKVANDNKKPLFANDPSSAARGAAAALGIDYEQVGYESGQMAAMFLAGKPMSDIPVQKASQGLLSGIGPVDSPQLALRWSIVMQRNSSLKILNELNTALGQLLMREFRPPPGTQSRRKPLPASS